MEKEESDERQCVAVATAEQQQHRTNKGPDGTSVIEKCFSKWISPVKKD